MDYSCPGGNYSILVVFRYMYIASYKKIPGQVQNYQTFQLSLVSVKSLKQVKHTGTTLGIL